MVKVAAEFSVSFFAVLESMEKFMVHRLISVPRGDDDEYGRMATCKYPRTSHRVVPSVCRTILRPVNVILRTR